jgi:hypothetical protein
MAIQLPTFKTGAIVQYGVKLPTFTTGAITQFGIKLPTLYSGENQPLAFTLTPTGGVKYSGAARVTSFPYSDVPFIPTGGIKYSGEATVAHYYAIAFELYPLGGIKYTGAAPVTDGWNTFFPTLGIKYTGAVTVTSGISVYAGTGGVKYTGTATILGGVLSSPSVPFLPSGGWKISGTATIEAVNPLEFIPTGGRRMSGISLVAMGAVFPPSGGRFISGAALIADGWNTHVPSGGRRIGGSAPAYLFPASFIPTAANPVNEAFPGWAINYLTNAPSRYDGLPANSITVLNGIAYVANAGGIYALTSITDDGQPIRASMALPTTDFGSRYDKRMSNVYFGYSSAGHLRLKVSTNTNSGIYSDLDPPATGSRGNRAKVGKGLSGLYWAFRLANVAGGDFEFNSAEITPFIMPRKGR